MRATLTANVLSICGRWEADEASSASDAINAEFGAPRSCSQGYFRDLVAEVRIRTSAEARQAAERSRADRARVARLQYLKAALYSDPTLLAIEYLDRNPSAKIDTSRLDGLQKFADEIRHREQWWSPIMRAWDELAVRTMSAESADIAIEVLIDAIRRLDLSLARRHGVDSNTATFSPDAP
ncbi:hypothetical protein [Virgisporangium aliadipatigenens]|uniref:hypothetical protein n=1 Tax=Virgisporangium aliadipatigenens TaxID=741659 RepID=UPI00194215A8|nr:hypothetical protein [Virgisporangium aliadipatigenens]